MNTNLPNGKPLRCVYGTSSNPFHNGHLETIQAVLAETPYEVEVIPSGRHPEKTPRNMASYISRLKMAQLGTEGFDRVHVSNIEGKSTGPSYMIETLRRLYPGFDTLFQDFGIKIPILFGTDVFIRLPYWKNGAKTLAQNLLFLVNPRGKEAIPQELVIQGETIPVDVQVLNAQPPKIPLSATWIRDLIGKKKSIECFVPPKVNAFIQQHRLYY